MGAQPRRSGQPVPGHRVVLRRRVGEEAGRMRYADVIGELVAYGDPVRIRRENGEIVEVPAAEVHRLKEIPARPVRTVEPLELAEITAAGWPPLESEWLGRWLLRAAEGWSGRANSVLPLGDPAMPVPQAMEYVARWYAGRGLPARFQMPLPVAAELDETLAQAGYAADAETLVQTASLSEFSAEPTVPVTLAAEPSPAWLATYHHRDGPLPPVAVKVMTGAQQPIFASVVEDGEVVAIARAVVDSGWLGVTALEVDPAQRRRGLAGQVMRALATWGAGLGARQCYLQVMATNGPALAFYERLGFRTHHRYHYRTAGTSV